MDFPDCRWRSDYCAVFHEPGRALRHIPAVGQQSRQQKGRHGLSWGCSSDRVSDKPFPCHNLTLALINIRTDITNNKYTLPSRYYRHSKCRHSPDANLSGGPLAWPGWPQSCANKLMKHNIAPFSSWYSATLCTASNSQQQAVTLLRLSLDTSYSLFAYPLYSSFSSSKLCAWLIFSEHWHQLSLKPQRKATKRLKGRIDM